MQIKVCLQSGITNHCCHFFNNSIYKCTKNKCNTRQLSVTVARTVSWNITAPFTLSQAPTHLIESFYTTLDLPPAL